MQNEHLQVVFAKNAGAARGVFAVPSPGAQVPGEYMVFTVISTNPSRRSYLQRAFALAKDAP